MRRGTRKIHLTQGMHTIVDADDYDWLTQWKWQLRNNVGKLYARRGWRKGDLFKAKGIEMHRLILGWDSPLLSDHINGNGLDNRRCNLRLVTPRENRLNTHKIRDGTSKYNGVYWSKVEGQWRTRIGNRGNMMHVGYFDDEAEAALAYDEMARKYHGQFALLNFPKIGGDND